MSLDVYADAEQIVAALSDEQCDAVMAALERRVDRWELEHPRSRTVVATVTPTTPARRKVGLVEAIRGVECCDPSVAAQWRLWRICFYMVAVIFCVVAIFGLLFGELGVIVGIGVASIWSMAMSFSITRGRASVCH